MKSNQTFVLFDGALGTYMTAKYQLNIRRCEIENLRNPGRVKSVHREYIAAGADAIKTNTFAANTVALNAEMAYVEQVVDAACMVAKAAAEGTPTQVFASIGPIDAEDAQAEYQKLIDCFLKNGVRRFLFETFEECETLVAVARYIKKQDKEAFVICECTVGPDGYTSGGLSAQLIIDSLREVPEIDAYGFNCTCGPKHMAHMAHTVDFYEKPVSIMPNAGYPTVINGRTVFDSTPEYFAQQLAEIARTGVSFLGGCCGTTPAHIARARAVLEMDAGEQKTDKRSRVPLRGATVARPKREGVFIAVELDSPLDAEAEMFIANARQLAEAGADLITVADCPIGRARADSSMLAGMLSRQYGIGAMPHLTCRDRNLNASKALLLGLHIEGVTDVLVVTGDPIPTQQRGQIKSVYNFNSVKYAAFIRDLNETVFQKRPFRVMGALNVNAENFAAELYKAQKKQEAGVACFLTQPIFDARGMEHLKQAKERLTAEIFAGIMPVVSYKNALFINNEIAGITIPAQMIEQYKDATKQEAAELAVENACKMVHALSGAADGFYLITALGRADIVGRIIKEIRK